MNKIFRLIVLIIGILSISSCAFHNGYINNSVSLNQANFKYTQLSVSGTSSTLKVFGIGGLNKNAIVEEAKNEMLRNHPLKSNQALANITLNWKSEFYFIVIINHCTMTADIVEFIDYSSISKKETEAIKRVKNKTTQVEHVDNNEAIQEVKHEDSTEEAKKINLIKNSPKVTETNYNSISEVKTGDIVKFKTQYGDVIYSFVMRIVSNKKIEVLYYSNSNKTSELSSILKYTEVTKVEIYK